MIDQSYPVYASAIDSGKHFLFFRETVKNSVNILSLGRKEMRPDFSIIQKVSHRHKLKQSVPHDRFARPIYM